MIILPRQARDKPKKLRKEWRFLYTAKVAAMTARILELAKGTARPEYPPSDMAAACEAMVAAGGFFVPWAEPPPPPPPPGPPVSAAALR
jgi:hypothetical protein